MDSRMEDNKATEKSISWWARLNDLVGGLKLSEGLLQVVAAGLVGLGTGAGVWLFKQTFAYIHILLFDDLGGLLTRLAGRWTLIFVPVVGGLLVGLIRVYFVKAERHEGVAGIMEAVALAGGRLRYQRMPLKVFLSALSIGSGASVGPEDPSVQLGANLGAMFGHWLHFSDERVRALVAAGSAGGIAAAFNAPIAGVFFALEIIMGELSRGALMIIVLAGVVSAAFIQAVSGAQPAFAVPSYALNSAWELLLYLLLGVLAGVISSAYIRLIYLFHDAIHRVKIPLWLKPASTGLALGLAALFLPNLLGTGYDSIELTLNGTRMTLAFLLLLLVGKLIFTPLSLGGGFTGGMFAPSLFLGAMLGAAYAHGMQILLPGLKIVAPAFAMVGMAAVLAGAVNAPLTAILLLFEMTNDYRIILPLMIAVVAGLVVSQHLTHESVYTLALLRKGIRLERGHDVEVLQGLSVQEVMRKDVTTIYEDDTLATAADLLFKLHRHGVVVVDHAGKLVGVFALQDLNKVDPQQWPNLKVGEICTHGVLVTHPDETLGEALQRMSAADVGRLPVVAREDPRHILGILRRADVIRAYDIALTRRVTLRNRAHQVQLGTFSGMDVEEILIADGSPCAGKRMREVPWPHDCVVASLQRDGQTLIPRGDTQLQAGDLLLVVAEGSAREKVLQVCRPDRTKGTSPSHRAAEHK